MDLPKHNSEYNKQEYWDTRFSKEDHYEWLVGYSDCSQQLLETLPSDKSCRICLIGCGNSSLGYDLYKEAGYTNIDNTDYSSVVIEKMQEKYAGVSNPEQLRWVTMDMMDMTFPLQENGEGSFDVIIDKGTMDVIMTDNKDPWNPTQEVKERARKTMLNVYKQLKKGGLFIQISFDQPHFRKKLLSSEEVQWAEFSQKNIDKGLGFFMYIMKIQHRRSNTTYLTPFIIAGKKDYLSQESSFHFGRSCWCMFHNDLSIWACPFGSYCRLNDGINWS